MQTAQTDGPRLDSRQITSVHKLLNRCRQGLQVQGAGRPAIPTPQMESRNPTDQRSHDPEYDNLQDHS